MSVLIRNASLLRGPELIFIEKGFIQISDRGIITRVGTDQELGCMERESTSILDAEGLLLCWNFVIDETGAVVIAKSLQDLLHRSGYPLVRA